MKWVWVALAAFVAALALGIPAANADEPLCIEHLGFCPDSKALRYYEGRYVGHDEPSVIFYSSRSGSGNSSTWHLRLPQESSIAPSQDGSGGTWNFQRSVTFWFGMDLCESQSYPNPGQPCTPDTDANIKDDSDSSSPNWVGNHVGSGFLELQFYPPGWSPFGLGGTSCDATRWCVAMAVFGVSQSLTQNNNADCQERAGVEWANFAFITKSGVPQAPPDPLGQTAATFTPDPSKVLLLNAGDEVTISIHDSAAGLVNAISDVTSGQSGSMTASVANGFAHPLFQPSASVCTEEGYAFHPMYSTASEHTRVPWAVHSYNVAFSDEIGHFEYCNKVNSRGNCVNPGLGDSKADGDDAFCFPASVSLLAPVTGCTGSDTDFDGTSYQPDWSGTLADPARDAQLHAQSFQYTSPLTGGRNYERIGFEADLPFIELSCNFDTGAGCVNPPAGAQFYPIYSTRTGQGACAWQEGGTHIPGTANTFGGTSTAEYGSLLPLYYPPAPGFPEDTAFSDYRNVLSTNPCPSADRLPR